MYPAVWNRNAEGRVGDGMSENSGRDCFPMLTEAVQCFSNWYSLCWTTVRYQPWICAQKETAKICNSEQSGEKRKGRLSFWALHKPHTTWIFFTTNISYFVWFFFRCSKTAKICYSLWASGKPSQDHSKLLTWHCCIKHESQHFHHSRPWYWWWINKKERIGPAR